MSSGSGTVIFLVIFFAIIVVLVVVAFVGSRKDKSEKLIKTHKERVLNNEANEQREEIFKKLNIIVHDLENEIADFKPSIGIKSLGEINAEYSGKVNDIINSEELKSVYLRQDYKSEMKEMIDGLAKDKPSNWKVNPESQFSMNLIKVKNEALFNKEEQPKKQDEKKPA